MNEQVIEQIKAVQKEAWGLFTPVEIMTATTAPSLVRFSGARPSQRVLDVGCGTGVVAVTAARVGCQTSALDLSPVLVKQAHVNCEIANVSVDVREGDVEAMPYEDASFDVVLSQFGHMFAPRPKVAIAEMLRVLKPGGVIAFSTWPAHLYVGKMFNLVAEFVPPPPGIPLPSAWGDPGYIREHLGDVVRDVSFDQGLMRFNALSLGHYRAGIEATVAPIAKLVRDAHNNPTLLSNFRERLEALAEPYFVDNQMRQHYLMTRAVKK